MDEMTMVLVPIVDGVVFYGIMQMIVRQPGSTFNRNFANLSIYKEKL